LRKLDKDYTGAAIRVRKDTTGQPESDIGFTASGDLDTASLKSFLNARSGFITTWYDQSTNARNATQATQALQPRIALTGVIDRVNTKPAIFYNGSYRLVHPSGNSNNYDFYYVLNTTDNSYIFHNSSISSNHFGYAATQSNTSTTIRQNYGTPTLYVNSTLRTPANRNDVYSYANNITSLWSIINTNISTIEWANINIGFFATSSAFNYTGYVCEYIGYSTSNSSNRTAIETNINNYYSIY